MGRRRVTVKKFHSFFDLPGRKKVPGLDTVTRAPTRRHVLKEWTVHKMDRSFKIDLEIWSVYPDNFEQSSPKANLYREKTSPREDWKGSFNGKRYFQGNRPNHYKWKSNPVEVSLKGVQLGFPIFTVLADEGNDEWKSSNVLLNWYYGGSPGLKLEAAKENFHDGQLVVLRAVPGDHRRGRFLKKDAKASIIQDLDSEAVFLASKYKLFSMDEQFLKCPYQVIRCLVRNPKDILSDDQVELNWPVFDGTDTLEELKTGIVLQLIGHSGLFLRTFRVEMSLEDTFSVDIALGNNEQLLSRVRQYLLEGVVTRWKRVENLQCTVRNISKRGEVWLSNDNKLVNALQRRLNEDSTKKLIRHPKLKAAAELGLKSSEKWFYFYGLSRGEKYIVMGDDNRNLYRALLVDFSTETGDKWFDVELLDFGTIRRLTSINEFWTLLPYEKLPQYINDLPPLCKKFQLDGVKKIWGVARLLENLRRKKVTVKVEDANRLDIIQERHCVNCISVPGISLKVINENGEVSLDVNKVLQKYNLPRNQQNAPRRRRPQVRQQARQLA